MERSRSGNSDPLHEAQALAQALVLLEQAANLIHQAISNSPEIPHVDLSPEQDLLKSPAIDEQPDPIPAPILQVSRRRALHQGVPLDEFDAEFGTRQRHSQILAHLESTPDTFLKKQQEVLYLHHKDGLSVKEIAKNLSKSPQAVYALLARAKERFEKHNQKLRKEKFELMRKRNLD